MWIKMHTNTEYILSLLLLSLLMDRRTNKRCRFFLQTCTEIKNETGTHDPKKITVYLIMATSRLGLHFFLPLY